jgi:hypothetical protein
MITILKAVPRWLAVALALTLTLGLGVLVASQATASPRAHRSGPSEAPGGTYFVQGAIVNFCFTHGNRAWLEFNTETLGNCPAGDVQLSVWADPDGVVPGPVATVTVTATPSS